MENCSKDKYTFFENKTTTGTSDYLVDSDKSLMNLKIESTGTFSINLLADIDPKTSFHKYPCIKMPTYEVVEGVLTDKTYMYQVDLHGIDWLRLEITAITGNVSVYGKIVG